MWNLTDKSVEICDRVIDAGVHADMIENLGSDSLHPDKLSQTGRHYVAKCYVAILHNVVRMATNARDAMRSCQAVSILHPFRACKADKVINASTD